MISGTYPHGGRRCGYQASRLAAVWQLPAWQRRPLLAAALIAVKAEPLTRWRPGGAPALTAGYLVVWSNIISSDRAASRHPRQYSASASCRAVGGWRLATSACLSAYAAERRQVSTMSRRSIIVVTFHRSPAVAHVLQLCYAVDIGGARLAVGVVV